MNIFGNIINFIVKLLDNKLISFTDFFSIFTVAVAVVSFRICHKDVRRNIESLKHFIQNKDEIIGRENSSLSQIKEKKLFKDNNYVNNTWDRYFHYARNNIVQGLIPEISTIFSKYHLIDEPGRRQIAQIIPGILTALGILGTFLGLQDGISKLVLDNPELIEESIKQLTDGMSLAFISSIVGIISSMIWSHLDRRKYKEYIQVLEEFYTTFDEKFKIFTPEYYLNEVFEMQKESTEAIKHIGTDISLQLLEIVDKNLIPGIENSMSNVITESIVPNINHINHTFENFTNSSTENQMSTLNTMINSFNNQLNETVSISFTELENTIKEFTKWHRETKDSLDSLIDNIEESALNYQEISASSEAIILEFSQLFHQISEINGDLGIKMDALSNATTALQEISTTNVETTAEINEIQKRSMESYAMVEGNLYLLKEDIEGAKNNLEIISAALDESISNFSNNLGDGLETTFNIFDENLSEISKRLSGTILEMQDTVEELPSIMSTMYNELQSHTLQLSEALEEANNLYLETQELIMNERGEIIS